jgi:hypothetical protein
MEPNQKPEKMAVFYATISPSQSHGHLGYAEGINTIKEARGLIMQTLAERRGRITKSSEDMIAACLPDGAEALKAAIAIQRAAIDNRDKKAPLNIRIFIDTGDGTVSEEDLQTEVIGLAARAADAARSGHIYVSTETYNSTQGMNALEFRPFAVAEPVRQGQPPYYDVAWHPETDCTPGGTVSAETLKSGAGRSTLFLHGSALLSGPHGPCFYCGSGKHKSAVCPSKQLHFATNGLERLGHLSMNEINRLFSEYLNQMGEDLGLIAEPDSKDNKNLTYLAPWAFYELKRAFQLRFLDVIWNASPKEDWHKARESKREGSPEGGMLWLARDCIRTSRLEEAEDLLKRYDRKNPTDYRTLCGLSFVKIEKENYLTAADLLLEALNQPTTPLHKTYILLMLARVHEFNADQSKSDDRLKDALGIEPYCPEATFELIIRYYRGRRTTDATNRLIKLIHICREYYTAALIAPELAKYQEFFSPELEKMVDKARGEAQVVADETERSVAVLKSFAGENDTDVAQVLSEHQEMVELMARQEALFNYDGIAEIGQRIRERCKEIEQERANHMVRVIGRQELRIGQMLQGTSQPRKTRSLLQPIIDRLTRLREDLQARAPVAPCLVQCEEMSKELDEIETSVKAIDSNHAFFMMWGRFSKDIVVAFFVTATAGLVLFPGAMSLLEALRPEFAPLPTSEIWGAQKAILLSGGLFALMFAGFRAYMLRHNPEKDDIAKQ